MTVLTVGIGINSTPEEDKETFLNRVKIALENSYNHGLGDLPITTGDIHRLCDILKELFMTEPMCPEIQSPIVVIGDIHGQFDGLMRIFEEMASQNYRFLLLGDYVDRGRKSLEVICYLFVLKALFPDKYFLLRGNHEDLAINKRYGFYKEVERRTTDIICFYHVNEVFTYMPVAAMIDRRFFCVHGGICKEMFEEEDVKVKDFVEAIVRPNDVLSSVRLRGLLWNDPIPDEINSEDLMFTASNRGTGISYFGEAATDLFLTTNTLNQLLRGHEICPDGFKYNHHRRCLTIHSAINYSRNNRTGSVLIVRPAGDNIYNCEIIQIYSSPENSPIQL